jgi:hypothetical protein
MANPFDNTGKMAEPPAQSSKAKEVLPERLMRRFLDTMGNLVDRKFGRTIEPKSGLTTSKLVDRMKRLIDERVRDEGRRGRIAPHHLKLKVEWGTHSEAPLEILKELEHEVVAAAIDHINDHRYRTLAPVEIETEADIFTTGITVDPTFGKFEEELRQKDEARRAERAAPVPPKGLAPPMPDISVIARASLRTGPREFALSFKAGGKRLNVGRAADSELSLNDSSVSKVHAALVMNPEGTLLVADTGSTNGTYINGRRITYGEARQINEGDVVSFGDVEVRFRKDD